MITVIAMCHRDSTEGLRLLKWIEFLSGLDHRSMRREKVLIVASRYLSRQAARLREIADVARATFGKAFLHVPATENEKGWPSSPNFMFKEALEHVEKHFEEDIFWLEPDAVPLVEHWFSKIKEEYYGTAVPAGKRFMGTLVPHHINHLSGVGVYGKEWRTVAPELVAVPEGGAWDTHNAPYVLPKAQITNLLQHVFHNPIITTLGILHKEAVVFHQDKKQKLMRLLDKERFGGQFFAGVADVVTKEEHSIMKYYHADNATKTFREGGMEFKFEVYAVFGGAVQGVYATQTDAEVWALDRLVSNPRNGLSEISKEDYDGKKKQLNPANSGHLSPKLQQAVEQAGPGNEVPPAAAATDKAAKAEAALPQSPQ